MWRDNAQALLDDRRLPNTFARSFAESHAMMDYPGGWVGGWWWVGGWEDNLIKETQA